MTSACLTRTNRRSADVRRLYSDGDATPRRIYHVSYRERCVSSDSISACTAFRADGRELDSRYLEYHLLQFEAWEKDNHRVTDDAAFIGTSETRPNRRDVDSARPNRGNKTSRRFEVALFGVALCQGLTISACRRCRDGDMKRKRRLRNLKLRSTI